MISTFYFIIKINDTNVDQEDNYTINNNRILSELRPIEQYTDYMNHQLEISKATAKEIKIKADSLGGNVKNKKELDKAIVKLKSYGEKINSTSQKLESNNGKTNIFTGKADSLNRESLRLTNKLISQQENMIFEQRLSIIMFVLGFISSIAGIITWSVRIQKYQDRLLEIQVIKAERELNEKNI
jgi:hypothetical protein